MASNPISHVLPKEAALRIVGADRRTDYSIVLDHTKRALSVVKHERNGTSGERNYTLVAHRLYKPMSDEPRAVLREMLTDAAMAMSAADHPLLVVEDPVLTVYEKMIRRNVGIRRKIVGYGVQID